MSSERKIDREESTWSKKQTERTRETKTRRSEAKIEGETECGNECTMDDSLFCLPSFDVWTKNNICKRETVYA